MRELHRKPKFSRFALFRGKDRKTERQKGRKTERQEDKGRKQEIKIATKKHGGER